MRPARRLTLPRGGFQADYAMSEIFGFDAFSPNEIAARVDTIGVAKTRLPLLSLLMLSVLAGAFIGLGALYFVLVKSDPSLGFAAKQILGGVVFALGLILVVVAGAELFTGNNLLAMAWADGKISTRDLLRNWAIVCVGNFLGAVGLALLVVFSRHPEMNDGAIAQEYLRIAAAKVAMPFWTAFFRGVLCNVLVCVAVWMALAGRSVIDKAVAIVFPISAFVAAGFEHSVANMYLIPIAMLLQTFEHISMTANTITWIGFFHNLVPVILGNIVGGSVLVGLVYHVIYRRAPSENPNA
jgi:formate/nitrite transporter